MEIGKALEILYREGYVGQYYGPGYHSWNAIGDLLARHPRGRGLRNSGVSRELYQACRVYWAERSRTKSYRPGEPGHKYPPRADLTQEMTRE